MTGNFRSSSTSIISVPTAPVAPTTATTYPDFFFNMSLDPTYSATSRIRWLNVSATSKCPARSITIPKG